MNINDAINLVLALLNNSAQISQLIAKAQSEGRSDLTAAEWADVLSKDDAARAGLKAAIDGAGAVA